MELQDPITGLKGIGEKKAVPFAKAGIYTISDLLQYYPRSYDTFEEPVPGCMLEEGTRCSVYACVLSVSGIRCFQRYQIFTAQLQTEDGETIQAVWFNMPFLRKCFPAGSRYVFRGTISRKKDQWRMEQPEHFALDAYEKMRNVMQPRYPLVSGLTGHMVSKAVKQVLDGGMVYVPEYLPESVREKYGLEKEWDALKGVHFPIEERQMIRCRNRLVFDEFLLFILALRRLKESGGLQVSEVQMVETAYTARLTESLPYELTGAQKRVWGEILGDMTSSKVMNRLVQGDVGSGKTILAVLALITAGCNGYQGAIMAPTEVLAKQHYQSITQLFRTHDIPLRPILLTGSMSVKEKRAAYEEIQSGTAQIIVGTHALIQEKVVYHRLGLVVTDEQHRFGVRQRESLAEKGCFPHVLVMSATASPRALAIIVYGDLDISVVDEMPADRLPIRNCVVDESYRPNAYRFIEKEASQGHQIYIICPMVEENDELELENVTDYARKLEKVFPQFQVACLHGRMKPKEKNEIMERFAEGEIQILISTTVIEVGINVPNATVMMVENSERFGLAQLHQLRGRVGRGKAQSYCIFMTSSKSRETRKRLEVLNRSNDGFYIASEDLKMRGPGDLFGIRQSGILEFRIGDVFQDAKVLQMAGRAADEFLERDPDLSLKEHRMLFERLERYLEKSGEQLNL